MEKKKIWAGRIKKDASLLAEKFTSSIQVDKNLYTQDLAGTAAYVIGLEDIGIITKKELADILSAMKIVREKIESQKVDFKDYEDIHSLIEFELEKLIGNAAGKIHTGRSRNDQIVVDELLFMKKAISETIKKIILLQKAIVSMAEENFGYVFPAYTHMQKAQPVLVSHYLLSYFEKFSRSLSKLFLNFENCDFLPLGAGACTGSGYALNRKLLASVLKFGKLASNSMDIVSSREHIVDFIYTCTMIMQNLSRFAEDLIIYNTREFSYINIDDAFCTGSSIMPQKKNPDILELVRGKSAIVTGNLMQILTLIKGLPLTYNSDLQEDKKILFNVIEETHAAVDIFTELVSMIKFNVLDMIKSCEDGFIEATDAADYLVKKGVSFREAHNTIGKVVAFCADNNLKLSQVKLEKLKEFSKYFSDDFFKFINIKNCINNKLTDCGTSNKAVKKSLSKAGADILKHEKALDSLNQQIPEFDKIISGYIKTD